MRFIKNIIKDIINGVFTTIFIAPAILLILGKYLFKQFIRVRNDILSFPSQTVRAIKLKFRKK